MINTNTIRLRACRKRGCLDQIDLATLLGAELPSTISRYERGLRVPETRALLAYEIIFNEPAAKLVPDTHQEEMRKILVRVVNLARKLECSRQHVQREKLEFLSTLRDRLRNAIS